MASNKTLYGNTFSANGIGASFPLVGGASSISINLTGTGSLAADVKLQVSNSYLDPNSWIDVGGATAHATNSTPGAISFTSAFARGRVVVSGMTGTAVKANVGVAGVDLGSDSGSGNSGGGGSSSSSGAFQPSFVVGDLTKWKAAKANGYAPRTGFSSQARFIAVGDSNISAQGAGTGQDGFVNGGNVGMAGLLGTLLGYRRDNFFGDQGSGILDTYRPGIIQAGAGWTPDQNGESLVGGRAIVGTASPSAGTAGALNLIPANPSDHFMVWHYGYPGLNRALSVLIDGVQVDLIDQRNGPFGLKTPQYAIARGQHTFGLKSGPDADGGVSVIAAMESFDSTSKTPVFIQGGASGTATDYWIGKSNPWSPGYMLPQMQPDFALIYLTINDATTGTPLADYYARMESIVAALAPTSNGCLCVGFPANHAATVNGLLDSYAVALSKIARDYGWFYADSRAVFGSSFTAAQAKHMNYNDDHPNTAGHAAFAQFLYTKLSAAGL